MKGTALMLSSNERLQRGDGRSFSQISYELSASQTSIGSSSDIQQHLQSMFYLLRPEETLKMVRIYDSNRKHHREIARSLSLSGARDRNKKCPFWSINNFFISKHKLESFSKLLKGFSFFRWCERIDSSLLAWRSHKSPVFEKHTKQMCGESLCLSQCAPKYVCDSLDLARCQTREISEVMKTPKPRKETRGRSASKLNKKNVTSNNVLTKITGICE